MIFLIHWQHQRRTATARAANIIIDIAAVQQIFPQAASISVADRGMLAQSADGRTIGQLLQTSPICDGIIGFSGPTNVLIGVDSQNQIAGITVLSSGDTRDHLQHVLAEENFLASFNGIAVKDVSSMNVDAVSGATLTSLAIRDSVMQRLIGAAPPSRFDDAAVTLQDVQKLFPVATKFGSESSLPGTWSVFENDKRIGRLIRTSPASDSIIGFQGPTDCLLAVEPDSNNVDRISGMLMRGSFDNEPYTDYVRDDTYFLSLFNDRAILELADESFDPIAVEGVSGATMTSQAVAEGVYKTAEEYALQQKLAIKRAAAAKSSWWKKIAPRDWGTGLVTLTGLVLGFTSLRGKRWTRIGFQMVLIVYLGLMNGDMISQALLVGWAQSGIPFANAAGLVLLTFVAFVVPLTTRANVFCSHLCPHGAVQQLVKNKLPWRLRLKQRSRKFLSFIPCCLLIWVIIVGMSGLTFSLVDIEPFDAWLFQIAGWATITVAVIGLVASLFVPMAYCRFGCPTGALLDYFRLNRNSHRLGRADVAALVCLAIAIALIR